MSARKLTDQERKQAIAYCEALADDQESDPSKFPVKSVAVAHAATRESRADDGGKCFGLDARLHRTRAAAMLRAGWSAGEPTPAQWLAGTVAVAHRLLAETGADVTIRCDVTPAVGAAMTGPVTATYTIAATGDAP